MCDVLNKIVKIKKIDCKNKKNYNNWGVIITRKDVKGLDIVVKSPVKKKRRACSLIFYKNQIRVDGQVTACACRDVNATLKIGDLNSQNFKEIYSTANRNYLELIESQQKGKFSKICKRCDYYRSIYKFYPIYEGHNKTPMGLSEFYKYLSSNK